MTSDIDINLDIKFRGRDELRRFEREIDDAIRNFQRFRREAIDLRMEMRQQSRQLDKNSQEFRALSRAIEAVQRDEINARQELERLTRQLKDAGFATDDLRIDTKELETALERSETATRGQADSAERLKRELNQVGAEADETRGDMRQLGRELRDTEDDFSRANREAREYKSILDDTQGLLRAGFITSAGAMAADFITDKMREIADWVNEAREAWREYDGQIREIRTLTDDPGFQAGITYQLRTLNIELGRLSSETLPATYQALSAGLDEAQVRQALEDANKLARTTRADMEKSLLLVQRISAAYGDDLSDTTRIADFLFRMVRTGIVTMDELNESLNRINSVAAEMKLPFEDVAAAVEVMTRQGDDISEVASLLGNLLMQIQITTTPLGGAFLEAAGQDFRSFIDQGGHLVDALRLIQEHADETGVSMVEMLGGDSPFFRDIEAARGVLELTGDHLDEFADATANAAGSSGELEEAWGKIEGSSEIIAAEAEAAKEAAQIYIGEALQPLADEWERVKKDFFGGLSQTAQSIIVDRQIDDAAAKIHAMFAPELAEAFPTVRDLDVAAIGQIEKLFLHGGIFLDNLELVSGALPYLSQVFTDMNLAGATDPAAFQEAARLLRILMEYGNADPWQLRIDFDDPKYTNVPEFPIVDPAMLASSTQELEEHNKELDRFERAARRAAEAEEEQTDALRKWHHHQALLRAEMYAATQAVEEYNQAWRASIQEFAGAELAAGESTFKLEAALWNQLQTVGMSNTAYVAAGQALMGYSQEAVMAALRHGMLQTAIEEIIPLIAEGKLSWDEAYDALSGYQDALEDAEEPVELDVFIDDFLEDVDTARSELLSIQDRTVTLTMHTVHSADYLQATMQQELEDAGIYVPPGQDQPIHWGGWVGHNSGNMLPGERVLSHNEIQNMGGHGAVDAIAAGGAGGSIIQVNDQYQAYIVHELIRAQQWRAK